MHLEVNKIIRMEVALGSFTLVRAVMCVECVWSRYSIRCALVFHYKEKFVCHLLLMICLCVLHVATSPCESIHKHLTSKESSVTFCPNLPHVSLFPVA